jgi:hypothetical protein
MPMTSDQPGHGGECGRTTLMKAATGIVLAALLAMGTAEAYDLDRHAWRDRLLIIAAPDADSAAVHRQTAAVEDRRPALDDRKMKVIELYLDRGRIDGTPLEPADVGQLRRHFDIGADEQVLLLIGKDGGVKRRAPFDTALREFFIEVDAMPMRQAEIRRKRAAGVPVTDP